MAVLTATASPSITLSLAPAARVIALATATPSIRLTLGPALARQPAQTSPSIRLTLTPTAHRISTATIHTGNGTTGLHGAIEEAIGYRGAR